MPDCVIALQPVLGIAPTSSASSHAHRPDASVPRLTRAGVAGHAHRHWGSDFTVRAVGVRLLALLMMAISIGMAVYAAINFKRRGDMLV